MPPIPTGLQSLIKVALLTFFGAFLGALSLSAVPTTLDGWKGVLMPALGAAIAAELVFLRQTIAAALTGTPVPANDTKPAQRGFARVGVVGALAAMALVGCALFSRVEPPVVDCGKRILDDAAKGMTLDAIVADVTGPCGLDAAAVIANLLAAKDPVVVASRAYGEARARHAAVAP